MSRGYLAYFSILLVFTLLTPYSKGEKPLHILNFYGDNGFKHASQQSSVKMIEAICHNNKWTVTSSSDPDVLDSLLPGDIALVIFNNNCGNSGSILSVTQWHKFQRYIEQGGAFLAIHCAGAIWKEDPRFQQWYENLLGATLVAHPPVQKANFKVEDQDHPATRHLPANWLLTEEMHTLSINPRQHSKVLISVNEDSYTGSPKMNGDHPMVWSRRLQKSRVFFSALGHTEEIYLNNDYVKMIEGGMKWCLGADKSIPSPTSVPRELASPSLLIDLNADKGLSVDSLGRIYQWPIRQDTRERVISKNRIVAERQCATDVPSCKKMFQ